MPKRHCQHIFQNAKGHNSSQRITPISKLQYYTLGRKGGDLFEIDKTIIPGSGVGSNFSMGGGGGSGFLNGKREAICIYSAA